VKKRGTRAMRLHLNRTKFRVKPSILWSVVVLVGAAVSACTGSGTNQSVFTPDFRSMIRPTISRTRAPACRAEGPRHKRRRVRCADGGWPPPSQFSTAGGSYCYQTNGGVVNYMTWYPIYNCHVTNGDTIDFGDLQAAIYEAPIGNQWCSSAFWAPVASLREGSILTFTINPNPTGGWTPCSPGRTDVTDVKMMVHWTAPWASLTGNINGTWTNCGTTTCSAGNSTPILGLDVEPQVSPIASPTGAPTSTGSPYPPTAPPLEIYDQRLNEVVSNTASPFPSADVGQSQSLLATASPGSGATVTDVQWTLPTPFPLLYQAWTSTSVSSVTPGPMPTATNPAQFYWIQGSSFYVVEVQAMVNSQSATAYALYTIEAPTFGTMSAAFAVPAVTNSPLPDWLLEEESL
jgi:hypothetical protein